MTTSVLERDTVEYSGKTEKLRPRGGEYAFSRVFQLSFFLRSNEIGLL
jgi:hypothetical protein